MRSYTAQADGFEVRDPSQRLGHTFWGLFHAILDSWSWSSAIDLGVGGFWHSILYK